MTLLYVGTYHGAQNLRGWAIADAPPNPFKLHWAVVEEPDKAAGTDGAIYILAQKLNSRNITVGKPRLYQLPFSPELAEQVDEALKRKKTGAIWKRGSAIRRQRPMRSISCNSATAKKAAPMRRAKKKA